MPRPLVSVVMATYDRGGLLSRSLECYRRQEFPNDRFELIVIDDHSADDTRGVCTRFARDSGISLTLLTACPKTEGWRDCGAVLNHGIRASAGDYIILTHPEVMPGRLSVARVASLLANWEARNRGKPHTAVGMYAACKVYYLSPRDQAAIDTVDWRGEGNLALRRLPGFYDEDDNGNPDYRHDVTDRVATPGFRLRTWDSWVFGGMSRKTWALFGGMAVTRKWGSVDVFFNHRRKHLKMVEATCPEDDTIVVHQNHDGPGNTPTPRDEQAWKDELGPFDKSKVAYPDIDELGW